LSLAADHIYMICMFTLKHTVVMAMNILHELDII
jgi:hypothetical protein